MTGLVLLALAAPAAPVVVTVSAPVVSLAEGGPGEVAIVARIREGFRVQANPASQPFLVAARLELSGDERVDVGDPSYPPGRPYRIRGAAGELSVYHVEFVIRVPLEAKAGAGEAPGGVVSLLAGRLHYQACNDRMCLRPASVPVEVRVRFRPGPHDAAESRTDQDRE